MKDTCNTLQLKQNRRNVKLHYQDLKHHNIPVECIMLRWVMKVLLSMAIKQKGWAYGCSSTEEIKRSCTYLWLYQWHAKPLYPKHVFILELQILIWKEEIFYLHAEIL